MRKSFTASALLAALGAFSMPVWAFRDSSGRIKRHASKNSLRIGSGNRYHNHPGNGPREVARRLRQMSRIQPSLYQTEVLAGVRSNENKRLAAALI